MPQTRRLATYCSTRPVVRNESRQLEVMHGPRHTTMAHARREAKRGNITIVGTSVDKYNVVEISYVQHRASRMSWREIPTWAILSAGMVMLASGVGLLALALYAVASLARLAAGVALPLVAALAVLWLLTRLRHRTSCVGLHCPGCR